MKLNKTFCIYDIIVSLYIVDYACDREIWNILKYFVWYEISEICCTVQSSFNYQIKNLTLCFDSFPLWRNYIKLYQMILNNTFIYYKKFAKFWNQWKLRFLRGMFCTLIVASKFVDSAN